MDVREKPKSISFKRLKLIRENLKLVLDSYVNILMPLSELDKVVDSLIANKALDLTIKARPGLKETLRVLTIKPFNDQEYAKLIAKIVGQYDKVKDGQTIGLQYYGIPNDEWALAKIVDVENHTTKKKHRGVLFTFELITGSGTTSTFNKFFPMGYLKQFSMELGFNKWGIKRFDGNPHSFVKMALMVKLKRGIDLGFDDFYINTNCKNYNKALIEGRMDRDETGRCKPYNILLPCNKCPIGYDKCVYGTRPISLTIGGKDDSTLLSS